MTVFVFISYLLQAFHKLMNYKIYRNKIQHRSLIDVLYHCCNCFIYWHLCGTPFSGPPSSELL